jgi:hypothetical protein
MWQLGYLMYKSGLVPRGMALLGLIGGPLAVAGGVLVLFGAIDNPSAPLLLITIPAHGRRTWSGRTPCSSRRARPSTSCST